MFLFSVTSLPRGYDTFFYVLQIRTRLVLCTVPQYLCCPLLLYMLVYFEICSRPCSRPIPDFPRRVSRPVPPRHLLVPSLPILTGFSTDSRTYSHTAHRSVAVPYRQNEFACPVPYRQNSLYSCFISPNKWFPTSPSHSRPALNTRTISLSIPSLVKTLESSVCGGRNCPTPYRAVPRTLDLL